MALKRERVSMFFGLHVPPAALDFVDVDVRRDTPLFVDPSALLIIKNEWAAECRHLIQNFFHNVLEAIRSDDETAQLYDTIGATYTVTRRTDPRIAARIWAALGDARTVLNVGAGTGSYEPSDRHVLAVEPSALMRSQRLLDSAPCLAGSAENLPFDDRSFDAAMAVCTVHHWQDPIAGLREMRRVARRVVVFAFDTSDPRRFWLTRDYLPEFAALRACRILASLTELARAIEARMEPVPIPWDCADGFFEAYWRRPEAYLDEDVRRGVSVWASVGPDAERAAVHSLRHDLSSGRWAERSRDLLDLDAAELGARLLIA